MKETVSEKLLKYRKQAEYDGEVFTARSVGEWCKFCGAGSCFICGSCCEVMTGDKHCCDCCRDCRDCCTNK